MLRETIRIGRTIELSSTTAANQPRRENRHPATADTSRRRAAIT
jgi:hypothetical protein